MATRNDPPPDEQVSRRPDVIQWWMSGEHQLPPPYHPMEDRMIHRYFSEQAPYFDWASKNGLMLEQSKSNRQLFDTTHSRQAFEEELRKRRGLEFMVTGEPQQIPGAPPGTKTGVWNLRKQNREKRREDNGKVIDELEVLGSYFIVGENVYQAPSVADVVGNKILDATTNLHKFCEKANSLSSWSPTTGYTYLPHIQAKSGGTATSHGTPARSREESMVPGVDLQSLRSGSVAPDSQVGGQTQSTAKDTRLFAQSLQMAIQFGDEYMDDNPILGEPGHFTFTSSTAAVKKRKADEEAAAAKALAKAEGVAASTALKAEKPPSPPAVMTESKTGAKSEKDRRARAEAKAKKRKSRAAQSHPATPSSATSPLPPSSAG